MSELYLTGQAAAPAPPAPGRVVIYPKTDNNLYIKDANGIETAVAGASVGAMLASTYDTNANGIVDGAETVPLIVRNVSGVTIVKGKVVYINGAVGQNPTIALAQANAEATSSTTLGIVEADILNNTNGRIFLMGRLNSFNTSAFVDGDLLYLSSTVAGGLQNFRPAPPMHGVLVGYCAYSHITSGTIVVKIDNGSEVGELHDVTLSGIADKDLLQYDSPTLTWKNIAWSVIWNSVKDITGGLVGLTLFKINFKNAANTFTSFLANANTAARTYTFPDKDGTVAMTSDINEVTAQAVGFTITKGTTPKTLTVALDASVSGTNTGDQTNISGNAATVTTNANLTGEVTSVGNAATVTNSAVIGKVITGFVSGAGTVAATDTILQAVNKLDGNVALKAPLVSPSFTTPVLGTPTSGALDNCTSNTEAANNNSTQLSTTAYADRLIGGTLPGAFTTLSTSVAGAPFTLDSLNSNNLKITIKNAGALIGYWGASATDALIIADSSAVTKLTLSNTGNLGVTGTIKTSGYTVATLPAGTTGDRAYVTDATAPTYLGALTGGGAVVCPVFKNATAWVSA